MVLSAVGAPAAGPDGVRRERIVDVSRLAFGRQAECSGNIENVLGCALTGLGRYEEGEALLLPSHEALRSGPRPAPGHVQEALEHLVALCTGRGKVDKAARWRGELDQAGPPSVKP
jgi:hypothetical protein